MHHLNVKNTFFAIVINLLIIEDKYYGGNYFRT